MSGACGQLVNSPSQAGGSPTAADLLHRFVHLESPRSSPCLFKRPSPPPHSRWKAALALLSPPRLLPAPAASLLKSSKLRRPRHRSDRPPPAHSDIEHPAQLATTGIETPALAIVQAPAAAARGPEGAASGAHRIDDNRSDAPYLSSQLASSSTHPLSNVQHLLLTLSSLDPCQPDDVISRSRSLDALCSLCMALPSAVDRCIAAGGIDIILNVLNAAHDVPTQADALVKESEKALLLLQLLTSSSKEGCTVARQHSLLTIATLGKKLLRVSEACTASTITVLILLCNNAEAGPFCKAVSETAIPGKLVVVLQVASKDSTKRKAGRLLRLLQEKQHSKESSNLLRACT